MLCVVLAYTTLLLSLLYQQARPMVQKRDRNSKMLTQDREEEGCGATEWEPDQWEEVILAWKTARLGAQLHQGGSN